jgi:hypothetical protein
MVVASKTTRRAKVAMEMAEPREGEALAILPFGWNGRRGISCAKQNALDSV